MSRQDGAGGHIPGDGEFECAVDLPPRGEEDHRLRKDMGSVVQLAGQQLLRCRQPSFLVYLRSSFTFPEISCSAAMTSSRVFAAASTAGS